MLSFTQRIDTRLSPPGARLAEGHAVVGVNHPWQTKFAKGRVVHRLHMHAIGLGRNVAAQQIAAVRASGDGR